MDFFGIGALELLVILVVALLVIGPERLPKVANRLGVLVEQARRSVAEARESFLADVDLDETQKPTSPKKSDTGQPADSPPSDSAPV
ncbi:MAG: Sec-independent protein translocase protein TatB [Dehalococcoidia bacterium]